MFIFMYIVHVTLKNMHVCLYMYMMYSLPFIYVVYHTSCLACISPPLSSLLPPPPQSKNASQFAAWSACLLAHEMFRKAQLTGTEGVGGETGVEGGTGIEEWMGKTQDVINGLKTGMSLSYATTSLHVPTFTASFHSSPQAFS